MLAAGEQPLVSVRGLRKAYGAVKAVENVDFALHRGEVMGLVGESGSGKTTVGRVALRLVEPTAGSIVFDGIDITALSRRRMRAIRKRMQMIFQDPFSSLNPYLRIGDALEEPLVVHRLRGGKAERQERVLELMRLVGLRPSQAERYPHEFSGGQRQRIGIARALASEPDFIVADEAVSALDVSIQAQIINLLKELQRNFRLTMLFISHDLGVVRYLADRTMVMYLGRIVEVGLTPDLFAEPKHPYTKALLSAIPDPDPTFRRERIILKGDVPSPINPPSGCAFRERCPFALPACAQEVPTLRPVTTTHHKACIRDDLD
ncbi:MAG: ABC transporter ATP-binding protein [Geminicoccaceae bacterium]